jgi:LysM repeat protein
MRYARSNIFPHNRCITYWLCIVQAKKNTRNCLHLPKLEITHALRFAIFPQFTHNKHKLSLSKRLSVMLARFRSGFFACFLVFILSVASVYAQDNVTHTVQAGENLYRIALRYGISMNDLAIANNISNTSKIYTGQVLIIPGLTPVTDTTAEVVQNPLVSTAPVSHTIKQGETLAGIARQYNISLQQIMQANNISNADRIYYGQVLQIWTSDLSVPVTESVSPEPVAVASAPATTEVVHVVRQGEYLSQIARDYGVSWTRIAEANGITDPNKIYAGLQLRIPDPNSMPSDLGIVSTVATPPGAHIGVGREVVVVLSTQMTYAYEDGVLVRSVQVSTGLPATPTVQGDYKIYLRYESQTMSGPGYYLEGVPYVMYFYQGYGLHGTYWHNNFGQPMSHGCVNMPTPEAEWFFNWTAIGTPVHVRWA